MINQRRVAAVPLIVALTQIAGAFGLDAAALIDHAYDDPHGGYHNLHNDGFPIGSMWRVEGQALYALVRALKPANVLELGTWHGCSATHILQALHDNGQGVLECVDAGVYGGIVIGDMIPDELRDRATTHLTTFEEAIKRALKRGTQYDLIVEDGMHDTKQVTYIWNAARRLLRPGGMILSHDAQHEYVGIDVQMGIEAAGYNDYETVLIAPSDCGYAMWRKAGV